MMHLGEMFQKAWKMFLLMAICVLGISIQTVRAADMEISELESDLLQEPALKAGFTDETQQEYQIEISDFDMPEGGMLRVAVWSAVNGQDDLKWNVLREQASGVYSTTVRIADYKSPGKFSAHIYYEDGNGIAKFFESVSFYVTELPTGKIELAQQDITSGKSIIRVSGIDVPSGVVQLRLAVWSSSNQSDLYWYNAEKGENGYWTVETDLEKHKNNWALYTVHAYATDGNGFQKFVGGIKVDFSLIKTIPVLALDTDDGELEMEFQGLTVPSGLKSIRVAVWSEQNGQDDIAWYYIASSDIGWKKTIKPEALKSAGKCLVHAYAENKNGELVYLGGNSFVIEAPVLDTADVQTENDSGMFAITFDAPISASGIQKVEVGIWSKDDKSDVKWYEAQKRQDGTYLVASDISEHEYNIGTYQIQIKVKDGMGLSTVVYETSMEFVKNIGPIEVKGDGNETLYDVSIRANSYPAGLNGVQFAVWSASGGQDDIRWYTAAEENETYRCTLDIRNHKTAGTYYIHTYGITKAGQKVYLAGASEPVVGGQSIGTVAVTGKSDSTGSFTVKVSDIQSSSGVFSVRIAVWTVANNQKDLKWYSCSKQSDGSYTAKIDIKNHNYNVGEYVIHVYVTMGNQIQSYMGGCRYEFKPVNFLYVLNDQGKGVRTVAIQNSTGTANIRFAVWSDKNGQDDIVWYNAKQATNGAWVATIEAQKHDDAGKYHVHIYAGNSPIKTGTFEFAENEFDRAYFWPTPGSSRITSYFGYRSKPTAGASTYHKGIDIGAPYGTAIVALNNGTVTACSYDGTRGYYIEITHKDGIKSLYYHMSRQAVVTGMKVTRGQTIGYVGSTGVSTGPHLHLGMMKNGVYVNPLEYVSP